MTIQRDVCDDVISEREKCAFKGCMARWTQEIRDRDHNLYRVCDRHALDVRPKFAAHPEHSA